ncbi:MAG TPA: NADP(H)-dependent aldo-keto reductase [Betaproteobacteria bacterium]|nr:NADP(H)-dependent aldo-keto reductase [Betaproteobacteria bacterium]
MEYRQLGDSDLNVSALCLGTMTFGEQNTEAEAHEQLDYAVSRGVNFIDTAEMYPVPPRAETQGRTERYVGAWLTRQPRDRLIVATKITGPGRGFEWVRGGPAIDRRHLTAALDASLQRLQTDYVDLYQIHWPDRYAPMFGETAFDARRERPTVAIEEQLAALGDLVESGKVRYIGLSNETPWGTMQFVQAAARAGLPKVVSMQNAYNLINRVFEAGLAEVCHYENVGLLAYSPLGFGVLSGKYLQDQKPQGRLTRFPGFGQRYQKHHVPTAAAAYAEIAHSHGVTPAVLGLAFVRSRPFTASTILGATTMAQLKENLGSVDVTLDDATLAAIEAIHARFPNPAP